MKEYDIIVVGAGHAGCEAAAAAANMGSKVLLCTMNMQSIAQMSCNPAMGGVAKGQIVREIDALGGYSGIVSDASMIQFRMLNLSKGPAMWSPRTQNDRMMFAAKWREMLEATPNVDFWQDMVKGLLIEEDRVCGVITALGTEIRSSAVVLTNGTFLNGLIHIGTKSFGGGRAGEKAALGITEQLIELGFESGRMKTGTPPRIDGRSLQYERMDVQHGDDKIYGFSFLNQFVDNPERRRAAGMFHMEQRCCWISYTNPKVHEILKTGFDDSPMFTGRIQGLGPRYCPSIEDKINRFSERDRHQIFVEPEGWNTVEIYVNGFSTSLPEEVQYKALQEIPGFEKVKMFRPGYAIEYDYFPPTQLNHSLETKLIKGLFFAGQINGTTGYEEAACQGLIAGINAHQKINGKEEFVLSREEAYIGVLIDDLINKGTDEPYRMFTSRAEFRILLRQDTADLRLTEKAFKLGLAGSERLVRLEQKKRAMAHIKAVLEDLSLEVDEVNPYLNSIGSKPIDQKTKAIKILLRPGADLLNMSRWIPKLGQEISSFPITSIECIESELKYAGYIEKEKEMAFKQSKLENIRLDEYFDYSQINSLSLEAREKLNKIKPKSIGQASRISGVNPADISVLLVYMGRG